MQSCAASHVISTTVSHRVHTLTTRDDTLGWVVSGRKQLLSPQRDASFQAGQMFMLAHSTQWDVVNEPAPRGHYAARILAFTPELVERFHQAFGQFAATTALRTCASPRTDTSLQEAFERAAAALNDAQATPAVRQHRTLEVLLLLAEQGFVFAPNRTLNWSDRVRRLVGQRPQAAWSAQDIARSFNLSVSTLQRRLAAEDTSMNQCLRETRLETALGLLQTTQLQVSEVAERCGYASHSRFSAAFRERFGFAPSHLRP